MRASAAARAPFSRVRNAGEAWAVERVWTLGAVPERLVDGIWSYDTALAVAELLDADLAAHLGKRQGGGEG